MTLSQRVVELTETCLNDSKRSIGEFVLLESLKPDSIVLATGSQPVMPPIPGIRNEKFVMVGKRTKSIQQ